MTTDKRILEIQARADKLPEVTGCKFYGVSFDDLTSEQVIKVLKY